MVTAVNPFGIAFDRDSEGRPGETTFGASGALRERDADPPHLALACIPLGLAKRLVDLL